MKPVLKFSAAVRTLIYFKNFIALINHSQVIMKTLYRFFIFAVSFLFVINVSTAQVPTYNLRAMNFEFVSINFPNDAIEFDIYMERTNAPVIFEYSAAQYFLEFNSGIIPGNFADTNVATYRIIGSDLPPDMQPRNPSMAIASNPPAAVLRLAANSIIGSGNGYFLPDIGFPGTKIVRMRILSKTGSLNPAPLNIQWRNPPVVLYATKIFAYIGTFAGDITTPDTHLIIDTTANAGISLINPLNNSTTALKNINFSWRKVPDAVSYKLQVSTDINFNNIIFIDSALTDTIKTISNVSPYTTYYWKVSGKNDTAYFTYSGIRNFRVVPAQTVLNNPPNSAASVPVPAVFSWYKGGQITTLRSVSVTYENFDNIVNDETEITDEVKTSFDPGSNTTYKLEIASDQNFNNIAFVDSAVTDTFKTVGNLQPNTTYYWKVTPENDSAFFISSAVWNFHTASFPEVILISPPNNALSVPLSFNFTWQSKDSAVSYKLQVAKDLNFINTILIDSNVTDTFKTVSGLDIGIRYYWKVSAKNDSEYFAFSPVWKFTTHTILITPPENYLTLSTSIDFSWHKIDSAVNYVLQVSDDPNLSYFVIIDSSLTDTFKTAGGFSMYTTYFWRVKVKISSNNFLISNIRNFHIDGPIPVELSGFTSNVFQDKVTLNWTTTSEVNNSGFDIERSIVNNESAVSENWSKTGSIAGNGNSGEIKAYSFSEKVSSGKYKYRLKQIDFSGNFEYFHLSNEVEVGIPEQYSLSQNYPNPFNPVTKIDYALSSDGRVNLTLHDISGREVSNIINEFKTAGYYTVNVNASDLPSGIYFYTLKTAEFTASRKMLLIK